MLGTFFRKVMWVGRATTFCVGLAVVLAVTFGVGTAALAAVPGDPFKLGRVNAVDRITSLVGANSGAMLRVDNNGVGPALALESEAGKAPLTVNAGAGKAANLDADKLDGLDSKQFLRDPGYAPWVKTVADSSRHKKISGRCPPAHMAISGSARVTATSGPDTGSEVPVGITVVGGAGTSGWQAEAQEMVPYEGDWYLLVQPLCVPAEPDFLPAGQ